MTERNPSAWDLADDAVYVEVAIMINPNRRCNDVAILERHPITGEALPCMGLMFGATPPTAGELKRVGKLLHEHARLHGRPVSSVDVGQT